MRDVVRCALCGDEIEDLIQTEKGELCEKCIAGLLTEQRIVSLPDDVFLKPIVLNEDTMIDRLRQIIYTCSNGRCYGSISHKLEPAFSCMYYSFVNEFEIYFRIRVRQGRKEEAVMLGKKLLEEMNTLELDDSWDRDYALSVLQDIIGVDTRIPFFEKTQREHRFLRSEVLLQAGQVSGHTCTAGIPAEAEILACLSGEHPRTPLNILVEDGSAPTVLMGRTALLPLLLFLFHRLRPLDAKNLLHVSLVDGQLVPVFPDLMKLGIE